jgi:uncharacterized phiE125 gp8 family phage protein
MKTNLTDAGAVTAAVSTSDLKTHARIYHAQDDAYIATLVLTATQCIENEIRRALITRAFSYQLEEFPASGQIILPRSPWLSVSSITYTDTAGATQTLASSNYHAYSVDNIGRVVLKSTSSWPDTLGTGALDVTVNFTAGYGAASANIPAALRHAVLLQAAHLYDNRSSVNIGNIVNEIPFTVQRLIVQYHSGDYQ